MRFHHIGYAVPNIQEFVENFFRPVFQPVSVGAIVPDPAQCVAVCFAEMQGGVIIELIEPLGGDSPVNSVLRSRRGGLYHLCFEVDNLDRELGRLRAHGCMPLAKPVPAAAFGERRIVFVLTPQRDILELVEAAG